VKKREKGRNEKKKGNEKEEQGTVNYIRNLGPLNFVHHCSPLPELEKKCRRNSGEGRNKTKYGGPGNIYSEQKLGGEHEKFFPI